MPTANDAAPNDELELLKEVVRQGEVQLTALAQARQIVASQATTAMSWLLTLILALTVALASIRADSEFAPATGSLAILWFGCLFGILIGIFSIVGAFGSWQHAGSNPRLFFTNLPQEELFHAQRGIAYLAKRFSRSRKPKLPVLPPPTTTKELLHETAGRYAQAIEKNKKDLAGADFLCRANLTIVFFFVCAGLGSLPPKSLKQREQAPASIVPAPTIMNTPSSSLQVTPTQPEHSDPVSPK